MSAASPETDAAPASDSPIPPAARPGANPGPRIAVIGAGATGTYALAALSAVPGIGGIVVFEGSALPGPGLPYRETLNDAHALANIAGIEVPPLVETLNQWACRQPPERLAAWGIAGRADDDRAFYPRVVLGAWLADQFAQVVARAPMPVTVRRGVEVVDVVALPGACRVEWRRAGEADRIETETFDRVIVATGYGLAQGSAEGPERLTGRAAAADGADAGAGHGLSRAEPLRVGILGTSLSGIDAVVALATAHGRFTGGEDGTALAYTPDRPWHATLMSREGLLPEADFWFPCPAPEPALFTHAAVRQCVTGTDGDLDRVFALFAAELARRDPAWAARTGLAEASADDFGQRYFAPRRSADPFEHAAANLAEAQASHARQETIAWRHAILQMHEIFAAVLPHLSATDRERFRAGLQRMFTDNYAAVPHLSIERLLALHRAGVLAVQRLGPRYRIAPADGRGWTLAAPGWTGRFDTLVDARGQHAAAVDDFPFPTLRLQLCAAALARGQRWEQGLAPGADLRIARDDPAWRRVHLCALPYLLGQRPFVQGLVECAQMAADVAATIAAELARADDAPDAADAGADDLATLRQALAGMVDHDSVTLADGAVLTLDTAHQAPASAVPAHS